MSNSFGIIYKSTNKITGKSYIGQTIRNLKMRMNSHFYFINKNDYTNYFHNSLRKYGKHNFSWEVIEKCNSKEELDEMEFHYINQYNTLNPNGYNMTLGGEGTSGYHLSDKTKEKISKKMKIRMQDKNNWSMFGKHHSKETREKIGSYHKNKIISEYHKKQITKFNSGENNPMFGKKHTDEVKEKISKKAKERLKDKNNHPMFGKKHSKETRKKISDHHKEFNTSKGENNSMYGKSHSNEARKKISEKNKNRKKKTCQYCGKIVDISNYSRWHGEKCKIKTESED